MTAGLVPQNNPINERELSLGPRLSLFSEVNYRPFPHYALVSKYKEMRTRLGWTISYKSLYFVHPSLELVRLFTGMQERSIDLVWKNVFFTFSVLTSIEYRDEALPTCLDDTTEQTVSSLWVFRSPLHLLLFCSWLVLLLVYTSLGFKYCLRRQYLIAAEHTYNDTYKTHKCARKVRSFWTRRFACKFNYSFFNQWKLAWLLKYLVVLR